MNSVLLAVFGITLQSTGLPPRCAFRQPVTFHVSNRMRKLFLFLAFVPVAAFACKPSPDTKPPAVEDLLRASAFVVYAEVASVRNSGEIDFAEVKVLEQFKGAEITVIASPAHSCGLNLQAGEKRIFFLSSERTGHALAYPWGTSSEAILSKLRALKR